MRPIAIGRKNWLFVGSERAGHRAAVLTSLIASCNNNEVEPWAYLKDIFTRLAYRPSAEQLNQLLPYIESKKCASGIPKAALNQNPERTTCFRRYTLAFQNHNRTVRVFEKVLFEHDDGFC